MRRLRAALIRLINVFRDGQDDDAEELGAHLGMQIDEYVRDGMQPAEAQRLARVALGGTDATRERLRDRRGVPVLDHLARDLRYGLRGLRRQPGFTATVVLTLGLGSGATAAIFSMFNQALLRPLSVSSPEQLVNLSSPGPKTGTTDTSSTFKGAMVFSYPLFRDLERSQTVFTGIAAYRDFPANVSSRGTAWTDKGAIVSGSYFGVLGLVPALGRLLDEEDDRTSAHVVVVSDTFWRTRLQASPSVLNESIVLNGLPMTIVGVTPPTFDGTALELRPRLYVPLTVAPQVMPWLRESFPSGRPRPAFEDNRLDHRLYLFARLKPSLALSEAQREINQTFSSIIRDVEYPAQQSALSAAARERFKARVLQLEASPQGQRPERAELKSVFTLLFAVTGIVLLIAWVNVANLLLTRAASRERELTIRLSLGAGRGRLVSQMLLEILPLAITGSLLGLLVARWTLLAVTSAVVFDYPALRFAMDWRLFAFATATIAVTTVGCGLVPAIMASRRNLSARAGGTTVTSNPRARTWLAVAQVALSVSLLIFAGLFVKSLVNMSRVALGMRVEGVTTFGVSPQFSQYSTAQSSAYFERVLETIERTPGVLSSAASNAPVLAGNESGRNMTVEGFTPQPDADTKADVNEVSPNFFRTLDIPMLAGRDFTPEDVIGAPKVAIVNEAFARKFNLGREAIGKSIAQGAGRPPDTEIVAVVADTRSTRARSAPEPQFYLPYRQNARIGALSFYVRSSVPTERLAPTLRQAVALLDPSIPIENLRSLSVQQRETTTLERLMTALASGFAGLATLLAAIGLYGVLAYALTQWTREFGIRMALGATTAAIARMIYTFVARISTVGIVVGVLLALGIGRFAQSMLFEVPGYDLSVTIVAVGTLVGVVLAAGGVPAWRASRINPAMALRAE